ncbi:hypothetical protein BVC80_7563g2 [Macleaya cordata]|uniref:Uncharacterized protein n=1 Tax=Macleaya cordata TaxID=56857 RepID=A0A200QN64_MACCD|nr:hypothetical protein BVC80_7563g2 [Macleaya cordata]
MQQLMKLLSVEHHVTWDKRNPETEELTSIFWADPESTLLAPCFPSLAIVDRTYKTNHWSMPLFMWLG